MSSQVSALERICYVHCTFCNTILALEFEVAASAWLQVSVPGNILINIVTVRCGHCSNLLSVNMGASLHTFPLQDCQVRNVETQEHRMECGSPSKCSRSSLLYTNSMNQEQMLPISPPEKRQRAPSAYNRFIKEEIRRIKANNPGINHREAFSTAAKNWAHFPRIHFGLNFDSNKQENVDEGVAAPDDQIGQSFF